MAKGWTKHGKTLAPALEGKCGNCLNKPEDQDWCNAKKRPVSNSHSCKDDFKARKVKKAIKSPITPKPKVEAKPAPKKAPSPITLREQRDEAFATLMDGAKEVIIRHSGLRISITKEGK